MIKTFKNMFKQDKEKFVVPKSAQAPESEPAPFAASGDSEFLPVYQFVISYFKDFAECFELYVCDISFICLDPCDDIFVHVISF